MKADSNPTKRWPAFFLIYLFSFVVVAAMTGNWAGSIGLMLVPALVGGLIVRRTKSRSGIKFGYGVFLILSVILAVQEFSRTHSEIELSFLDGCLNRNAAIAAMQFSADEKKELCAGVSDEIILSIMFNTSLAFLTFTEPEPISSNPSLRKTANEAWERCLVPLNK